MQRNSLGAIWVVGSWPVVENISMRWCSTRLFLSGTQTNLSSLHLFGGHYNDARVLLKHHPPEVTDGVLQAALSGDVALLHLGAVTLRVQLRLGAARTRTHTKRDRKDSPLNVQTHERHNTWGQNKSTSWRQTHAECLWRWSTSITLTCCHILYK